MFPIMEAFIDTATDCAEHVLHTTVHIAYFSALNSPIFVKAEAADTSGYHLGIENPTQTQRDSHKAVRDSN